MKKKIVWLVVSCLMVATLLLPSCAPAVVEEKKVAPPVKEEKVAPPVKEEVVVPEKKVEMVKLRLTKLDGTVVEKMVEKPRYGGTLTEALSTPILGHFPSPAVSPGAAYGLNLVTDVLAPGDWTRGPVGTGEASWSIYLWPPLSLLSTRDGLAESWEVPDPDTIIYHLRKGIRFQDKPPVNGREFIANDVISTIKRFYAKGTYYDRTYPWETHVESITASDKYTVVVKVPPGQRALLYESPMSVFRYFADEGLEKYGSEDVRAVIGTGAFILVDNVPAVSMTLVRNPNYWNTHPLYPEDAMPYLDGVRYLIIPDASTRMAALRTAKIDLIRGVSWDDAKSLMKTNPELKWNEQPQYSEPNIAMRLDKPELPFADIRVRQALSMGINRQPIKDLFYGGKAYWLTWPYGPVPEHAQYYTPLEKQPESIRELWSYNPEKAKRLLVEAGYPQGFKTEIAITAADADLLSIVKEDWAKIGVDLKLDVKEFGVYTTLKSRVTYSQMVYAPMNWKITARRFPGVKAGSAGNPSAINDPIIEAQYAAVGAAFPDEAKVIELMREYVSYWLKQVYMIPLPTPAEYTLWQPWVKDFHGEQTNQYTTPPTVYQYLWIDQDLKEEMTGVR